MKHESVLTDVHRDHIIDLTRKNCGGRIADALAREFAKQAEKAQPVAEIRMTQYLLRSPVASVDSLIPIEQFNALPNGTKLYLGPPTLSALLEAAEKALQALEYMHKEKFDYMIRNKLGDPTRETATRLAVPAIANLTAAIEAHKKGQV